jgi:hypothetical protein
MKQLIFFIFLTCTTLACHYDSEVGQFQPDFLNECIATRFVWANEYLNEKGWFLDSIGGCNNFEQDTNILLIRGIKKNALGLDTIIYPFGEKKITNITTFEYYNRASSDIYNITTLSERTFVSMYIDGKFYEKVMIQNLLGINKTTRKWVITEAYLKVPDDIDFYKKSNLLKDMSLYTAFKKSNYNTSFYRAEEDVAAAALLEQQGK